MSSKNTIFLTNDHNEHCYFDCSEQSEDYTGVIQDVITIEFSKENIRLDSNNDSELVLTITNVDSEIHKVFSKVTEKESTEGVDYLTKIYEEMRLKYVELQKENEYNLLKLKNANKTLEAVKKAFETA